MVAWLRAVQLLAPMALLILLATPPVSARETAAGEAEVRHRPIRLEEALQISLRRNAQLQSARAGERQAEAAVRGARAFLYPWVTAEAHFMATQDPVSAFGIKLRQGAFGQQDLAIDALNEPDTVTDWAAAARLQWQVGDPARWAAWSAARHQSDAARWRVERTREATELQTRVRYYQALQADAYVAAARAAREAAAQLIRQFRRRQDEGTLTRADLLQAEARVAAADADLIEAINSRRDARLQLGLHLGWGPETVPVPADSFGPTSAIARASLDPSDRADLKALEKAADAADAEKLRATLGYAPRLQTTASVEVHADEPFDGPAGAFWSVMVSLQWPLFQGFQRSAARAAADAQRFAVEVRRRQALQDARGEVRRTARAVCAARQVVEARSKASAAADEARRVMLRRFQEGLMTAADILQAESRAVQMRVRQIDAIAGYHLAVAQLTFALGSRPEVATAAAGTSERGDGQE